MWAAQSVIVYASKPRGTAPCLCRLLSSAAPCKRTLPLCLHTLCCCRYSAFPHLSPNIACCEELNVCFSSILSQAAERYQELAARLAAACPSILSIVARLGAAAQARQSQPS